MFDVGDIVKTNETAPRTGHVTSLTADGRYLVCFDAANSDCAIFTSAQLTLVKDEPTPGQA